MTSFLPEGLSPAEHRELQECVDRAAEMPLDALLQTARDHVERTQLAYQSNPLLDLALAQALLGSIEKLLADWMSVPKFAECWCKGMILYFASCNEDEDDHQSPIGFDDDAEVINACLTMAGREDLCVDPEECEGAV